MSRIQVLRRAPKFLHEIASIGFGGGLAVCLLINLTAKRALHDEFIAARHLYAAIAQYIVIPSMVIVVMSGLVARCDAGLHGLRLGVGQGAAWPERVRGDARHRGIEPS